MYIMHMCTQTKYYKLKVNQIFYFLLLDDF